MIINGRTRVYGIFGDPIAHSFSPEMHNAAFEFFSLPCSYLPFKVNAENLPEAVTALRALNIGGVNITIPHKEKVINYLDEIEKEALLIGAVNTIVNREGYLIGYNTDGPGLLKALEKEVGFFPEGKKAVILGAGGAARAASFALALREIKNLNIFNRTPARAVRLAGEIQEKTGCPAFGSGLEASSLATAIAEADLVIHASPVGMYPHSDDCPLIDTGLLPPEKVICDLIYNPPETRFLTGAKERGCRVVNGTGMLVYQGALAFELWTGRKAPVAVMQSALVRALNYRA